MHRTVHRLLCCLLLAVPVAHAQTVINDREILDSDRPEAWAMNHAVASTFMTSFGATPALTAGHWDIAMELGSIPSLSARQRQVGFNGFKTEDLNKSPAFGRLRFWLGLPHGWIAELGFTPPLSVNGLQARGLVSAALARRWLQRDAWSLSSRVFGQHGSVVGDITCPAELAGVQDPNVNPFECLAPSRDRARLNHYGADITFAAHRDAWQWHAGLGVVRTELSVHLDALTAGFRDRTYLSASGELHYFVAGVAHSLGSRWQFGGELLYVPISVRRDPARAASNEGMTSVRLQLLYHTDP